MKTIWLSHILPYPPRGGAAQRAYFLLRALSARAEIHLVAFNTLGADRNQLHEAREEMRKHCSTVEFWPPAFRRSRTRMMWELGTAPFRSEPLGCRPFSAPRLAARWKDYLAGHLGAVLHCDTLDLAPLLAAANGTPRVLTHHNCESHLASRRAAAARHPLRRFYLQQESNRLAGLERSLCGSCEVNVVVSAADAQRLAQVNPRAHVHVVDNGVDEISHPESAAGEADPPEVLFAGLLDWEPNITAVEFFLGQIWPRIHRAVPQAVFRIAGRNPAESLQRVAAKAPNVTVVPNPPEMRGWFERAAVFVCPLLAGGGTRIKILEAMAAKTAVVSTTVGYEGLELASGQHLLAADEPEAFADAVVRLLDDRGMRQRLAAAGQAKVAERYRWQHSAERLWEAWCCAARGGWCTKEEPHSPAGALSGGARADGAERESKFLREG
jgi:glycosyltransferase involved in cell wall biosynthesis